MCVSVCMHACMNVYMCVSVCRYVSMRVSVCMYVCMYVGTLARIPDSDKIELKTSHKL